MTEVPLLTFGKRHQNPRETRDRLACRDSFRAQNSQRELDRRLDQALEETFPASNPISVMICLPN